MAKRERREKGQRDNLLGQVDFKGLAQDGVLGRGGLVKQLTGRVLQKILEAETDGHPGYKKHGNAGDNSGDNSGDSRDGHSGKKALTENQETGLRVPRDRDGAFKPQVIPECQKRVPLFNGRIIPMYSFGMTGRDIKSHLGKIYNVEVPPDLISRVTGAVLEEVKERQNRRLEKNYAVV